MSVREFLSRLDEIGVYEPDEVVRDEHPRGGFISGLHIVCLLGVVAVAVAYYVAVTR